MKLVRHLFIAHKVKYNYPKYISAFKSRSSSFSNKSNQEIEEFPNLDVDKFGNKFEKPVYPFPNIPIRVAREGESLSQIKARLVYQCRKRGILECELILSTFAKLHLESMSEKQCLELDAFLDHPDWDIFYWVTGERLPPNDISEMEVFNMLKKHAKNEAKVSLRMPEL